MKITQNFKNKVKAAALQGVTHIASICGQCYTTEYLHYISIQEALNADIGENLRYCRHSGVTHTAFAKNHPDAKVIGYRQLMRKY